MGGWTALGFAALLHALSSGEAAPPPPPNGNGNGPPPDDDPWGFCGDPATCRVTQTNRSKCSGVWFGRDEEAAREWQARCRGIAKIVTPPILPDRPLILIHPPPPAAPTPTVSPTLGVSLDPGGVAIEPTPNLAGTGLSGFKWGGFTFWGKSGWFVAIPPAGGMPKIYTSQPPSGATILHSF